MHVSQGASVSKLIDEGPFSPLQIMAILLCSLVAFLDGVDSQSIAVGVPVIAGELGLPRASIGIILSSALLGAMVGAMTFGPLGDRFGRKRMLVLATATFGVFTLATAYAASYPALLAIRFCAGLGLGGATPLFLALASEYAPRRRRAAVASLIWAAFPVGAMAGGFINSYILHVADWRTMFTVGGACPLLVTLALVIWLPESLRFLAAGNRNPAEAARIVARIAPSAPAGSIVFAGGPAASGVPIGQLFAHGRAVTTVLLWVLFVAAFGTLAIIAYWTPALLRESGISASQTALVLGFQSVGSILGMASAGRLMERFGAAPVIGTSLALGAVATGMIGFAATSVAAVSAIEAVSCFFVGMGASGSIALAALVYPTALRSSGIGWAMGLGRGGQVAFTLLTGYLVGLSWGSREVFLLFGLAPLVGAAGMLLMHWQARRTPAVEQAA